MFQSKTDKIFKDLSSVHGTAGDHLTVQYDETGHDFNTMVKQVMQISGRENLKTNQRKCHFRCVRVLSL